MRWLHVFLRARPTPKAVPLCKARCRRTWRYYQTADSPIGRGFVLIVSAPDSKSLHLLCIDPHTLVGDALCKILTNAGYDVFHAEDLEGAIRLASAECERINVVISDHDVPPGSALDVLEHLKKAGYRGRAIVYSNALTPKQRAQYSFQSVDVLVEKPDDAVRLLSIMKALHREP